MAIVRAMIDPNKINGIQKLRLFLNERPSLVLCRRDQPKKEGNTWEVPLPLGILVGLGFGGLPGGFGGLPGGFGLSGGGCGSRGGTGGSFVGRGVLVGGAWVAVGGSGLAVGGAGVAVGGCGVVVGAAGGF